MKLTSKMVVPDGINDAAADIRHCNLCGRKTFFVPQKVLVMTKGGARSMRLWACEVHPFPEMITDEVET